MYSFHIFFRSLFCFCQMKRYEKSLHFIGFGIDRDQIDALPLSIRKQSEKKIVIHIFFHIRMHSISKKKWERMRRKVNTHLKKRGYEKRKRDGALERGRNRKRQIQRNVMFMTFLYRLSTHLTLIRFMCTAPNCSVLLLRSRDSHSMSIARSENRYFSVSEAVSRTVFSVRVNFWLRTPHFGASEWYGVYVIRREIVWDQLECAICMGRC